MKKVEVKQTGSSAGGHTCSTDSLCPGKFMVGMVLAVVAIIAASMLVLDHLGGFNLPGCGEASGCHKATNGPWGSIPGLNWSVSYVGLAYFLAVLVALVMGRKGLPLAVRCIFGLGVLGSLVFIGVMIKDGYLCQYCLALHIANILLTAAVALPPHCGPVTGKPGAIILVCALVFFGANLALWPVETYFKADAEQKKDDSLDQSIKDVTEQPDNNIGVVIDDPTNDDVVPFTGRYLHGPEDAPIRIMVFTDYACPDCLKIERQMEQVLAQRDDVSLSVKHFPMSNVCNPNLSFDMHPKACFAARAAEAAGILRGDEGYYAMHFWLFENVVDKFDQRQLPGILRGMGYDPQEFMDVMNSDEVGALIAQDIDEAIELGLFYTPMVFINGVQIREPGIFATNAVIKAVDAIAATNPEGRSPIHDQPMRSLEKHIADWAENTRRMMPRDYAPRTLGPADAPIAITVWGDYQEPLTAELDAIVRGLVAEADDIQYTYRHYPFDQDCNTYVSKTVFPNGCDTARAAETAYTLGGPDAFWVMHDWLMNNQNTFNDTALRTAISAMGLDANQFYAELSSPDIAATITEDCKAGKPMLGRGIPAIYVNGRQIPRWKFENRPIIDLIIDEARQELAGE